jgi:glycosyltransferase involved in cell wall biosynthesis
MRVRVIHISPTAFGSAGLFGGGERYPFELARALAREIDCKLVTFGTPASVRTDGDLGVTVLQPLMSLNGRPVHPIARGWASELAEADIIHAHHPRALPSRTAAIEAWWRGQRRVATDHGLGTGRIPQLVTRLFDRFLTVSRYSGEILRSPAHKNITIYGGADTERFRPEPREERSGVLFVGRLTPHKGVDRLIEALPRGAKLTIVGTVGHDRRAPEHRYPSLLARLAEGRDVHFVARASDDELAVIYRRARALVLPSVQETCYGKRIQIPELLGLSLLEAMASGTPVIASRVGGLPEVVVDGQTGFVVDPGNVEEIRSHLEQLLGHDRLVAQMGDNGRQHVVEHFTWRKCAERCLRAYEDLIGAA